MHCSQPITLARGETGVAEGLADGGSGKAGSPRSTEQKEAVEGPMTGAGFEHRIKPVGDGMLSVLGLCAGFQSVPPGVPRSKTLAYFGVALCNHLLIDLPFSALEVLAQCSFRRAEILLKALFYISWAGLDILT